MNTGSEKTLHQSRGSTYPDRGNVLQKSAFQCSTPPGTTGSNSVTSTRRMPHSLRIRPERFRAPLYSVGHAPDFTTALPTHRPHKVIPDESPHLPGRHEQQEVR